MIEKILDNLTSEELERQEDEDRYLQWMKDHPSVVIAPENRRECQPEVVELENLMDLFESEYPIEKLNSIVEPTLEGYPLHQLRELAKEALESIQRRLRILKAETNIAPEKEKELEARRKKLSDAVGYENRGKIRHG